MDTARLQLGVVGALAGRDGVDARQPGHHSYLLRDGRLYLSLMADGGIYVWEPLSP